MFFKVNPKLGRDLFAKIKQDWWVGYQSSYQWSNTVMALFIDGKLSRFLSFIGLFRKWWSALGMTIRILNVTFCHVLSLGFLSNYYGKLMFWQSDKLVRKEQVRIEVRTQNTILKKMTRFWITGFDRLSMSSFDKSEQQLRCSIL